MFFMYWAPSIINWMGREFPHFLTSLKLQQCKSKKHSPGFLAKYAIRFYSCDNLAFSPLSLSLFVDINPSIVLIHQSHWLGHVIYNSFCTLHDLGNERVLVFVLNANRVWTEFKILLSSVCVAKLLIPFFTCTPNFWLLNQILLIEIIESIELRRAAHIMWSIDCRESLDQLVETEFVFWWLLVSCVYLSRGSIWSSIQSSQLDDWNRMLAEWR